MSKKKKKKKMKKKRKVKLLRLGLSVVFVALIYRIFFYGPETIFNITAKTELVQFSTKTGTLSLWNIPNATIIEYYNDSIYKFSGSVKLPLNALISVERISYGALKISFQNLNSESHAQLYDEENRFVKSITTDFRVFLKNKKNEIEQGNSLVLPLNAINGVIMTGSKPVGTENENPIPLMRSGKIVLMSQSLFNSGLIETGSFDLQLGDQFTINEPNKLAYGFIVVNEEPNLTISYSISGSKGVIENSGRNERIVSINIISKILNDKILSLISLIVGALLPLIIALTFYIEYIQLKIALKNKN